MNKALLFLSPPASSTKVSMVTLLALQIGCKAMRSSLDLGTKNSMLISGSPGMTQRYLIPGARDCKLVNLVNLGELFKAAFETKSFTLGL